MSSYSLFPQYKSFLLKKLFGHFFCGEEDNQKPKADLAVTVTNDVMDVIPGTEVVYTVTVHNYGSENVSGASLSEALPSALTNVEYYRDDVSPGNLLEASSLGDISVDIPAGGYTTYRIKGFVASDVVGELNYGVEVEVPEGFVDPDLSNNSASDIGDRLTPVADLSVTVDNAVPLRK
ncbi:MAG: DUF11 domain-containing protein [Limnothrix sp. RL_2_0]|nr:DUF11 domain-containing protein [Limnothrix sp. RL_2_0]